MGEGSKDKVPGVARRNIQAIIELEEAFLQRRTAVDRFAGRVSRFVGSISFVTAQGSLMLLWLLLNARLLPVVPFDPYPFNLLDLMLGTEAVLVTTFVLMTQNRQSRLAEH